MNPVREENHKGSTQASARDFRSEQACPEPSRRGLRPAPNGMTKTLGILGGLSALFLIWFIVIRPAIAGIYLKQMETVDSQSHFAEYKIKDLHQTIIPLTKFTSAEIPYRYRYVELLMKLASVEKDSEKKKALYQEADQELEIIYQKNPGDFDYYPTLINLMIQWKKADPSKNEEVKQIFQQAVSANSNNGFLYYLWGEELKEVGEYQLAKEKLTKALALFAGSNFPGITPEIEKNLELIKAEIHQELVELEKLIKN
ncbi:MAG: hypothetical protein COY66_01630 [Candidatus Kerfeldbacteria bacterium CG_4_10_14_0_8_um_filter_42_10]|uniref:Tetratricopeptide repeat-like domain-containing protein n=1 Tax=Candidatus Kerfeldbacteria bacterium CG_4_10_14_0_8_um_filter_42_10 TaxID=2014248 RepID=A0A2M7RKF7_9BACT|nr:MAG: hypothetical protein COY66_01630 [Candidatus Kerfeldbacteria bacterium CG_4_10_14_0_8_um_filter_42_10]